MKKRIDLNTLMDPKSDFVFKKIFGEENDRDILIDFLNAVLKLKGKEVINDIEIRNPGIPKESLEDKYSTLDIKAELKNKKIINIEMQLFNKFNHDKRAMYYWAKLYEGQLGSKEDYAKLNPVISISILNFVYFKKFSEHHSVYTLRNTINDDRLNNDMEFHFLELPKFKEEKANLKEKLDKWLIFLKDVNIKEQQELVEQVIHSEGIQKAYHKLEVVSLDAEQRELYEIRQKALKDAVSAQNAWLNEGREEGREIGAHEKALEIAKSLIKTGMSVSDAVKITGITEAEI